MSILTWNPETNRITWHTNENINDRRIEMAKEMKQKKEEKKAPLKSLKEKRMMKKEKHMDEKEDMAMIKNKVKAKCMK